MVLTRTLYGEEAAKRPDLLPEQDKERIRTLSSAVAAVVGGVSGSRDGGGNAVDVLSNAQVGGVVGRNAVENNYYLTPVAASHSEQEAREIYRILKDQIDTTCGNSARINECRAYIGHIVNFLQNKELSDKYPDLTNQSKRFLANHSDLVESFIRGERQRLEAMDKSAFFRYVIPGSQMVFGTIGVASSVTLGGITCAESAGLGCMGAGVGVIASTDEMTTGARNFGRRASEQQPTRIVQAFMATGMSRDSAETTSLLISLGAAGVSGAAPKAGMLFNRSSNTARYATAGSFTTTPGSVFSAMPRASFGRFGKTANLHEIPHNPEVLLPNLYPGDPVVAQNTIRRLVQDSTGRYWLKSGTGRLITPSGNYDFITTRAGHILVTRPNSHVHFSTHLGLSNGQPVKYAGRIRFFNNNTRNRGSIIYWDGSSGHYKPANHLAPNAGLPINLYRDR